MKKVFWGFVVLLCLLFAGCSNVIQIDSQVENTSKSLKITAKIAGDCGSFGYRSIMPASITYSKLYYYLLATNYYSKDVIEPSSYTKLTVEGNSNSGIIEITNVYEPAYYIFELYGLIECLTGTDISSSNIKEKAVLSSVIYKDTRYSSDLNFELSPANINKNGSLKLKIFTTSNWECDLKKYSVNAILLKDGTPTKQWEITSQSETEKALLDGYQIPETSLPNGTYNLNIEFSDKTPNAKKYIYSDGVYIYGNQTTEKDIYIPDIIDHAPDKPSDLTASYKIMDSGTAYYANFSWNDNSNNEHYFKMEVRKLASSVSNVEGSANDFSLAGESIVLGNSLSETYYDSTVNEGNNLLHHSGTDMSIKLKFALGEKYIVRLCAVNDGGASDWCYLNLSSTETLPEGYSDSSGSKFIYVEKS